MGIRFSKNISLRVFVGALVGVMAFLLIYGVEPLNIYNDSWILSGYAEWDVQQHYAGWLNFINSEWNFPLGNADKMGYPTNVGVNISFTDSMPLLSVIFKAVGQLFNGRFQWFGIYEMLVFVLQGVAAMMLFNYFELPAMYSFIGTAFFCFSPIMVERAFRHIALSSHYIIIFSLLMFFMYRRKETYPWVVTTLLSVLSVGITPYFLPMFMVFVMGICVENIISHKSIIKAFLFLFYNIIIALLTSYVMGSLFNGYSSSRGGVWILLNEY